MEKTSRQVDIKALISHIVRGDGADRCRICMGDTAEGLVHLEDTVMLDGDKPVTLAELLEVITGVEVLLDDGLPLGLCPVCSISAFQAADFHTLCKKANQQWENTVQLLSTISEPKLVGTTKMIAIIDDNTIYINEEQPKLPPPLVRPNPKRPKILNIKRKCQCPSCGKRFTYPKHLSQHLSESSDNQRACHICAAIMTREELVHHSLNVHNIKMYECKQCPAMLSRRELYKSHLVQAHAPGACTCGECGRTFKSEQGYNAHLSIHCPKNCPSCETLFRNQKCYRFHVKKCCNLDKTRSDTHRTKNKVTVTVTKRNKNIKVGMRGSANTECICDYCNKTFAGKKSVAAHINIVHTKNTHRPCVYCGKLFAGAHMSTHLKKHESKVTYQCGHCGIVLKTKLGYSQHVRLHTGERPYRCQYCNESFMASSRRSAHILKTHRTAEDIPKHACGKCPARFRRPYRLKKHIKNVHGEGSNENRQFECNVCHQKLSSCRGLLNHSRTHQEIDKDVVISEELVIKLL